MCTEEPQDINIDIYLQHVLPEDRETFNNWLEQNLQGDMENSVDYRILYQKQIFYIRLNAFTRERHKDGTTTMEGYIQNITDIQRRRNDLNPAYPCHKQFNRRYLLSPGRRYTHIRQPLF